MIYAGEGVLIHQRLQNFCQLLIYNNAALTFGIAIDSEPSTRFATSLFTNSIRPVYIFSEFDIVKVLISTSSSTLYGTAEHYLLKQWGNNRYSKGTYQIMA